MEKIWLKSYEEGVPETIETGVFNSIPAIFDDACKRYAERPSFHNMGRTLTYSELQILTEKFASYLQNNLRLKRGDKVAIMMPNILQYPIALFGALKAGMVVVNVNPLYTARELEHQLKDSGTSAIVIFANAASLLEKIIAKTSVKHVLVTQIGDFLKFPKSAIVNFVLKRVKKMVPDYNLPGAINFVAAVERGDQSTFKPADLTLEDHAFLQYTGGTTGVAKGAILTHKNIVSNMLQARAWLKADPNDPPRTIITPLPLYHIFSLTANCLIFCSIGTLNVLITNPRDIPGFVKELKKWKFTDITGVNTLFNALVNNPDFANLDFSHLIISLGGGMAVQQSVAEKWKKITGRPLLEAYGLTETSPAACINPTNLPEYNGYIGLPICSTEVAIFDDEGKDVPLGEVGEISIRGPQVTQGYWERPEETAQVMTKDGYFRTGDLGFMTPEGYVKLVDRKKDMILVSGFNVYPNEVEDVVATHPKVLEVAAIGVPDEKSGEIVKIFVVKNDESLTADELKAFCKESLTGYKVPKQYEFRAELPKTNVGKILRKDLRN